MDIKDYIASGIIDSYVLGSVSSQEGQEIQCLSKIYPEIAEELQRAEMAIEAYASSIAVTPPAALKQSILERIRTIEQDQGTEKDTEKTIVAAPKTIQLPGYYKWSAAASVLIIVGLSFLYMNASKSQSELSESLASVQSTAKEQQKEMDEQLAFMELNLQQIQDREAFFSAPNTRKLALAGTDVQPNASASIYWDESTGKVILASLGMPAPQSGKQYQLWAIADGQPVDLGVLSKESQFTPPINVTAANVQAFAITLEKDGGSPTPTLEQLYVIGNV